MSTFLGPANQFGRIEITDEEKGGLWLPALGYGYRNRGPQALSFQWNPDQRWPSAGLMSGDRSVPLCLLSQDAGDTDIFGPWSLGLSGHRSPYFLTGICKDASDNVIGGATVQAFITSTDAYAGEAITDDRGVYQVGLDTNVAHYLVAYYPGAPDKAGSSVNTLIPTRG